MGNTQLSASERLLQFRCRFRWQQHIDTHIRDLANSKVFRCQHLRCATTFELLLDLLHHFHDVHCIEIPPYAKAEDDAGHVKRPRITTESDYTTDHSPLLEVAADAPEKD